MNIPQSVPSFDSNSIAILQRKIKLKGQALKIIWNEREEMKQRLSLLKIRESLLKQMEQDYDPSLSRKLDCIDFLLRAG